MTVSRDHEQMQEMISRRLDNDLSRIERGILDEHLRTCVPCRRLAADMEKAVSRLREVAPKAMAAPRRVEIANQLEAGGYMEAHPPLWHRIAQYGLTLARTPKRLAWAMSSVLLISGSGILLRFALTPSVSPPSPSVTPSGLPRSDRKHPVRGQPFSIAVLVKPSNKRGNKPSPAAGSGARGRYYLDVEVDSPVFLYVAERQRRTQNGLAWLYPTDTDPPIVTESKRLYFEEISRENMSNSSNELVIVAADRPLSVEERKLYADRAPAERDDPSDGPEEALQKASDQEGVAIFHIHPKHSLGGNR